MGRGLSKASMWPRSADRGRRHIAHPPKRVLDSLQCGRGLLTAEGIYGEAVQAVVSGASMWPRSADRGRGPVELRDADVNPASMWPRSADRGRSTGQCRM